MSFKSRLLDLLAAVFGRWSWEPPAWLSGARGAEGWGRRVLNALRERRRVLLAVFLTTAAGTAGALWYLNRPPPPGITELSASVEAPPPPPHRTRAEAAPPPAPVSVTFDGSAAPLEALDRVVKSHVSLRPAVPGEWKWTNERVLTFTPQAAWPIGQRFTMTLDPQLVERPTIRLRTRELSFDTTPFTATLSSFEFYQDPVDPQVKQVVGTFSFNYPADPDSFEKRLELVSAPVSDLKRESRLRLTVSWDDLRYQAFVRSEALPVPLEDHQATLRLASGTKPEAPGAPFEGQLKGTVQIPGRGNRFRVSQVQATIARNAEGDPDQVLVFSCSSPVNEGRFAEAVKVWVLPKDRPAFGGRPAEKNYAWVHRPSDVGPEVLKRATRLKLVPIPGEQEAGQVHSFKLETNPDSALFVRVEAGLEAFGGYVLLKPYETVVQVPQYPREIRLAHEGAVLSVSGDRKLTVTARGIPGFKVWLYRVQPKDLNHLITQSSGDFAHLTLRGGGFSEENVSEVFSQVQKLDETNPRAGQYSSVDFSPHLKEGSEQRGLFFVRVDAWNPKTNLPVTATSSTEHEEPQAAPETSAPEEAVDREDAPPEFEGEGEGEGDGEDSGYDPDLWGQLSDRRFVLLTDLGVVHKVEAQQNHWVFVQSFKTGSPVAGAQVEVLAKNGTVAVRRATDATGVAQLPSFKDLGAEKTAVALVVRSEGDVSFLPLQRADRSLDLSRFDVGGVRTRGKTAALRALAFSDRGLYRPGETAHLGALVRAVDWSRSMRGLPLNLTVLDPRGLPAAKQRVVLDGTGLASWDFTPVEQAPTGTYTFNVAVAEEKGAAQLGSASFRVEEFLPDRMRLNTRFTATATGWVTTNSLEAVAELRNLFGTPAADHRVTASFSLAPWTPRFSQFPEHQFADPSRAQRFEEQRLSEQTTDQNGDAHFTIDLASWAPATWQVTVSTEGFELGGGRSVTSAATAVVSPRRFLLGYKPDGDLGFVKRGVERRVELIAVDSSLKKVKVDALRAALVEQRYVSVLTRDPSGSYRYQSVLKDVTKKNEPLVIGATGTTLALPSGDVGTFFLSVRDALDVELLRIPWTVAGEANVAKDLERNAELKVSLDKPQYEPGDTITVQITAPYAGAGVITIERDRVYAHQAFRTSTTSTVQTITVPAGLEANGYLQVAFVRALDSPEVYTSPLSYGVVPFKVLKRSQQLELQVSSVSLARPGRPLELKVKADRRSKALVWAVDEGILQVARYQPPDPLGFFLARRALEVSTHQIVDLLLPEFRLVHSRAKEGGGEGEEADRANLARNLNPFKRKADLPAVYWSGLIEAGPEERTLSFIVPESFGGSLRIMAVAASEDAMASARAQTTIRGPFVIAPNTPTFVSPKDRFVVSAAIANNVEGSGDKAQVTVSLKPSGSFAVVGPTSQVLTIGEMREAVATFEVTATDALGDGTLAFLASGAKEEALRTAHVSVRPASGYLVSEQAGSLTPGRVELPIKRKMFEQLATRELIVSLLPLGIGRGAIEYLERYPHLCSEQLTSRIVPALVFARRPEWGSDAAKAQLALSRAFDVLRTRQNESGQFGVWAANSFVSDPLNVYIALVLTEARDRKVGAPLDVLDKALSALKAQVHTPVATLPDARLRAMTLYVLARNSVVLPAPTAQAADWLGRQTGTATDVAFAYLAATAALTNNPQQAQRFIERFVLSDKAVAAESAHYLDDRTYRAQVLYLIARHFPARLDAIGPKALGQIVQGMLYGHHSLSAGWTLLSLDAYATAVSGTSQGGLRHLTAEVQESGSWKPQPLEGSLTARVRYSSSATAVRLVASDGPPVFYSLIEAGFDRDPPVVALSEGLELIHTLERDDGTPITRVKLGDEANLHLRARTMQGTYANVAIVDLLPSGFELVLTPGADRQGLDRLVTSGTTWRPDQVDAREDRVNLYGTLTPSVANVRYRVKAIARGTFVLPSAQAGGMYDPQVRARSVAGSVVVE